MPDKDGEARERFERALQDQSVECIYFNGFALNLGTGDLTLVLERNDRPVAVLNASYTVAKTLAGKLNGLISVLESRTGNNIMSVDDVKVGLTEEREVSE